MHTQKKFKEQNIKNKQKITINNKRVLDDSGDGGHPQLVMLLIVGQKLIRRRGLQLRGDLKCMV